MNKITPQKYQHNPRLQNQHGASLIEVMVAVVVLSIGLLGLGMLQAKSLRLNTDAYLRTQATLIASEFIEDMRANPTANYAVTSKPAPICGGCTVEQQMAHTAILRWYVAQENLLPLDSSNPSTVSLAGSLHTIKMNWKERGINVWQEWVVSL